MVKIPYPKVMFICRGSLKDGIGHVTRSKAVAELFRETAAIKMIIIGEDFVNNILCRAQFEYTVVNNDIEILSHFENFTPDIIIYDLTHLSQEVHEKIVHERSLLVSLSPIFNLNKDVDIIFNRTRYCDSLNELKPKKYCGLEYSIIANHVKRIPESLYRYTLQQDDLAIAISMGGTDAPNKTLEIIKSIKNIPQRLLIWAILGEGYSHSYSNLVNCIQDSEHEIILTKTNNSMWRILGNCALLLLAGGTTTYESAYAGLPTVNILDNSDHYFLVQELVDAGVCLSTIKSYPYDLDRVNNIIIDLSLNRSLLLDMHLKSYNLFDDQGAWRVMNEILKMYNNL